jgi:hypothetical protein
MKTLDLDDRREHRVAPEHAAAVCECRDCPLRAAGGCAADRPSAPAPRNVVPLTSVAACDEPRDDAA